MKALTLDSLMSEATEQIVNGVYYVVCESHPHESPY